MPVDLHDAQSVPGIAVQQCPYQGRFAGAARAPEQGVVGRIALEELAGILLQDRFLPINADQFVKGGFLNMLDRFKIAGKRVAAPVGRGRPGPVDRLDGLGQKLLHR